jgi:hypothetical protein
MKGRSDSVVHRFQRVGEAIQAFCSRTASAVSSRRSSWAVRHSAMSDENEQEIGAVRGPRL